MRGSQQEPWPTPAEVEVIEASPTRQRVEYIPAALVGLRACRCPGVMVYVEPGTHAATLFDPASTPLALKVLHRESGHQRVDLTASPPARAVESGRRGVRVGRGRDFIAEYLGSLPPPRPCPECGNPVFTTVPPEQVGGRTGWRRCDGPHGCGREFDPAAAPATTAGRDRQAPGTQLAPTAPQALARPATGRVEQRPLTESTGSKDAALSPVPVLAVSAARASTGLLPGLDLEPAPATRGKRRRTAVLASTDVQE